MTVKKAIDKDFFELPHPAAMIFAVGGIALTALVHYNPAVIPTEYLGSFGQLLEYLAYQQPTLMMIIWYAAALAHISEGFYCYFVVCPPRGVIGTTRMKWGISTFLFGIFSMRILIAHHKPSD